MAYNKYDNYPSLKKPGVYPSGSIVELGLDNDNLEKFSLGNWNSFVGKNKIFIQGKDFHDDNAKGRPVNIAFDQDIIQLGRIMYRRGGDSFTGDIITDSISTEEGLGLNEIADIPTIQYEDITDNNPSAQDEELSIEKRDRHFAVWGYYYDGGDPTIDEWNLNNQTLKVDKILSLDSTMAFIKPRDGYVPPSPLVFEFDDGGDMGLTLEREVTGDIFAEGDFTHELFFPIKFGFGTGGDGDDRVLGNIIYPPLVNPNSDFGFWELEMQTEDDDFWNLLGSPTFSYNFFLTDDIILSAIEETSFSVNVHISGSDKAFLYRGELDELSMFDSSYPIKAELNLDVYGSGETFLNEIDESGTSNYLLNLFYMETTDAASFIEELGGLFYYTYQVIQWGDEKSLLTDDQIKESYFFSLYDTEEYPEPDNYFLKKWKSSRHNHAKPIQDLVNHTYNTPGVKSIKIIVYKYDKFKSLLLQTYLVNKNIVINDGLLKSQDFSIFGGTDFNFLPLSNKEAIIGGLDEDSKYNNSVEKIKKDDNFIEEDYLERQSSRDFIDNFNKGLYGETPGQLDLSTTRMYKKPLDIYDFITNDKQSIVDNNFNINTLPINSFATDIFISNNDCIVDLNPQDIEYLSIQNKTGTADKAILIGDYKVNQPKGGRVQKQGVMQTPLLEQNTDKQAF